MDLILNCGDISAAALTAGRAETSILISLKTPISILFFPPYFSQEAEIHSEQCEQPGHPHALCWDWHFLSLQVFRSLANNWPSLTICWTRNIAPYPELPHEQINEANDYMYQQ